MNIAWLIGTLKYALAQCHLKPTIKAAVSALIDLLEKN
jgi:hypothetical protein